jgi:hypothetical protein
LRCTNEQAEGLNFATLNAGCLALDPSYTCNLTNVVNCVGGPLNRRQRVRQQLPAIQADASLQRQLLPGDPGVRGRRVRGRKVSAVGREPGRHLPVLVADDVDAPSATP